MPKTAKEKAAPKKPIVLMREDYLREAARHCTHFTKSVDTHAAPGGFRIFGVRSTALPYAAVRLTPSRVPLSYIDGMKPVVGRVSAHIEQVYFGVSHEEGKVKPHPGPSVEITQLIQREVAAILETESREYAPEAVSPRLRQILVEDGCGQTISISPLHSPGFSLHIKECIERTQQTAAEALSVGRRFAPNWFNSVVLLFGGSNPQNAGTYRLMTAMRRGCLFAVPSCGDKGLRKAFAIYHQGFDLQPPLALVRDYIAWLRRFEHNPDRTLRNTWTNREIERGHILKMLEELRSRAASAALCLSQFQEVLPALSGSPMSASCKGLIDASLRDEAWVAAFSIEFAQRISLASRSKDGSRFLTSTVAASLEPYIQEYFA